MDNIGTIVTIGIVILIVWASWVEANIKLSMP